jgi:Transglutaminase-like superfamily
MWKAFQRYRELDPEARKLFQRAAVLLPLVALSLRARGFKKTKEALEKRLRVAPSGPVRNEPAGETVERTARSIRAGVRYGLVRPTCLAESLALWYLLRRHGLTTELRIGVRKTAKKFEAHAWVEFGGVALNQAEQQHRHYAAFDSAFSNLPGESS